MVFFQTTFQVKAYGPGLDKTGVAVNKPAEFTVDAKSGGKAPLKVQVQVRHFGGGEGRSHIDRRQGRHGVQNVRPEYAMV